MRIGEMSERKIVVPEGMLTAAWQAVGSKMAECVSEGKGNRLAELYVSRLALEAALLWLSENPIVPTKQQEIQLFRDGPKGCDIQPWMAVEWQRMMFLAPDPGVPEEIKDMLPDSDDACRMTVFDYKRRILEAFRRGQKAGSK